MDNLYYKVYAKLDNNNCIIGIESTAFYNEQYLIDNGYVMIDRGEDGKIYGHAQPNYLIMVYGKPIVDEQFRYNYKLNDNLEVIELSGEEKETLFIQNKQPNPTEQEKINAQIMLEIAKLKIGA